MTTHPDNKTGILSRIDRRHASFLLATLASLALLSGIVASAHGDASAAIQAGAPVQRVLERADETTLAPARLRAPRLPRSPQRFAGTAEGKRLSDRHRASTFA
ncbi:hypothetical protein [Phreatobacter stygius]|uniref:Uncharacterized protein n=1 Tax=Phreatobacter stygius TaxID=1940610 RepID=A0A4D7B819_9HYPH|nr:hypothetical protein [Phreatobacter stygius]QCI64097.1 hypothetical protein E8M01_07470 [Phreatobacter stygius]